MAKPDPKECKTQSRANTARPGPDQQPDQTQTRPKHCQINTKPPKMPRTMPDQTQGQTWPDPNQIKGMAREQQARTKHDQTQIRSQTGPESDQTQTWPDPKHTHNSVRPTVHPQTVARATSDHNRARYTADQIPGQTQVRPNDSHAPDPMQR